MGGSGSRAVSEPGCLPLGGKMCIRDSIDSFNEETAVLFTELGELTIRGSDLHMNKLNVDTGEVTIEGEIHTLVYTDDRPKKLFARLFQ